MKLKTGLILGVIWLLGAVGDRLWFALDNSVPAWDQADYLNGVMNYWQALQTPQWFNTNWWLYFWQLSSKIPPLTYIITTPFINIFGTSADAATLVMLLFSAILLLSIYGLGVILFNAEVGLWAAAICQLLPGLYRYRLDFLLDYPLTTVVTLSFFCLTLWKLKSKFITAILFGISLGVGLMVKQTALFFLFLPILWLVIDTIKNRKWLKLTQLITAFGISLLIFGWWYRINWLLILTSGKRATIDSAIAEGDPALNTLNAWIYYLKILPYLISWPLLLIPVVGLLIYGGRICWKEGFKSFTNLFAWRWLTIFLLGGYLLSSANINKDPRYILPLLPVFSLILAVGLLTWTKRWLYISWGVMAISLLLMWLNIFPLGWIELSQKLSPAMEHHPYQGKPWPNEKVVQEIVKIEPYLRSTLGVLPSTPEINQHNFSFYGKQNKFQVAGRQVGVRKSEIQQDARSLCWFITKTEDQGSIPDAQKEIVKLIETGNDFQLQKTWQLPDESDLKLYHCKQPPVIVKKIDSEIDTLPPPTPHTPHPIKLDNIIIPEKAPSGLPIPVTYQWSGNWEQLHSGIVLLTWQSIDNRGTKSRWLHDHGIGLGALHPPETKGNFQVIENLAMLPPSDLPPGKYSLTATYLNRQTGANYPLTVPDVTITIDPETQATPAPELDLVTQLRTIAPGLAKGREGIDPIFAQTARINQYDPIQDYLAQADLALSYRLNQEKNSDWAYTIALSRVLRQDVEGSIAALKQVTQLDSQNPYSYAYLAFVYLYDWRGGAAQQALKPALALNPNLPELQALSGVAAFMQGNLLKAWQLLSQSIPQIE